jgi:hypothetical protein
MTILVAVTTYQPLMNVRMLLIGNKKLWHITAVLLILDLMQFRLDNMEAISLIFLVHYLVLYIKLLENGTDLSAGVTKVIDLFANIFRSLLLHPSRRFIKL